MIIHTLLVVCVSFTAGTALAADAVDFSRDVLPLLSNNCFQCHGPDEANREAGLRLDQHDAALAKLESGTTAVVPGNVSESELIQRITTTDSDLKMPPEDSGKSLTPEQIALITKWVEGGAEWSGHWAFEPAEEPGVPAAVDGWAATNPIDRFIQRDVKAAGMSPEARASKETLIRRATLDLTGLPPTIEQIDATSLPTIHRRHLNASSIGCWLRLGTANT